MITKNDLDNCNMKNRWTVIPGYGTGWGIYDSYILDFYDSFTTKNEAMDTVIMLQDM